MDDSTNPQDADREREAIERVELSDYVAQACADRTVTVREATAVVEWVREWAQDCVWQDACEDDIRTAAPLDLLRVAQSELDGGLAVALEDVRRLAIDDYRERLGFEPIQPLARFDVSETTASGAIAYRHRSIEAPDIATAGRQALASLEPGWRILAVRPLAAPLASFTAIYREPAKPSIFEQAVTAVSFDAALEIANREASAHGLVVVALAAGNPQGFGSAILAAQVEQAGSQDV